MHHSEKHSAAAPPVIEIQDLWVSRGELLVLQGINMHVPRGQLVALIGPNGSGKTTLLRALVGLQKANRGVIRLFGNTDRGAALRRIGYVPQRFELEPGFIISVREFLALRLRKTAHWFWMSHKKLDGLLRPAMAEIGVETLLDKPLAQLSGGQLQRVLIAFSLLHKPDLLLLDEPTAGVDMPGELGFYDLIAKIQKQHHLTVVLVSHDLSMVYRHADWIYALNRTICCEGSPEQVMNAESLKLAYGEHVSPYHHAH